MKVRMIEKNIIYNKKLLRCGLFASTLFQRLILVVDDCGRFYGDAASVRAAVFPMVEDVTEEMIEDALLALSREGVVHFYEVRGERYLFLTGWDEHQLLRYKTPVFPAPVDGCAVDNNIISISKDETRQDETRQDEIPPLSPPVALPERETGGEDTPRAAPCVRDADGKCAERFQRFWEAYPRRLGRFEAKYAFEKLRVDNALLDKILWGIERWRESEEWKREDGRFIPSATTFLKGRRWEDVPPRASPYVPKGRQEGSFDTDDFFAAALQREFHIRRED